MPNSLKTGLRALAEAVLNDDDGICEAGYNALLDVLDHKDAKAVSHQTDATDGRFYASGPIEWRD